MEPVNLKARYSVWDNWKNYIVRTQRIVQFPEEESMTLAREAVESVMSGITLMEESKETIEFREEFEENLELIQGYLKQIKEAFERSHFDDRRDLSDRIDSLTVDIVDSFREFDGV